MQSRQSGMTQHATRNMTIFVREDGAKEFVPLSHPCSLTLRQLAEDYSISSVIECDEKGLVQARAIVFDSPNDVLHRGKHYIARRDVTRLRHDQEQERSRSQARNGGGDGGSTLLNNSRVTFRGKILVKEFDLENTPISSSHPSTNRSVTSCSSATATSPSVSTASGKYGASTPAMGLGKRLRSDSCVSSESQEGVHSCTGAFVPADSLSSESLKNARVRFAPFSQTMPDGSTKLVSLQFLRDLCSNVDVQEYEQIRRHKATLQTLSQRF